MRKSTAFSKLIGAGPVRVAAPRFAVVAARRGPIVAAFRLAPRPLGYQPLGHDGMAAGNSGRVTANDEAVASTSTGRSLSRWYFAIRLARPFC